MFLSIFKHFLVSERKANPIEVEEECKSVGSFIASKIADLNRASKKLVKKITTEQEFIECIEQELNVEETVI